MLAICRRTKNNDEFLEYYTCSTKENAEKKVKEINTNHPSTLFNGVKIDWNITTEFFVNEQNAMY